MQQAYAILEQRVTERTQELAVTNTALQAEVTTRRGVQEHLGLLQIAHDDLERLIAERTVVLQKTNAELAASEERFRATFELAAAGIARVALNGCWLEVNNKLCEIVGYPRAELLTLTFQDITYPDDLNTDMAYVVQMLAGEITTYSMEKRYIRKDGSLVWIDLSVALVRDAEEKPQHFIAVVEDISDRKAAQEALERMNEELEARVNERTAELMRSNADLQQFAYVASHDLQEPLRMVASFMQLLEKRYKGQLDAQADRWIEHAVGGATRMQALINDLLTYSRVETNGKEFRICETQRKVALALENLQLVVSENQAEVTFDALPAVQGDESQLVSLFQNLIGNALKYRSEQPPRIHISARQEDGDWLFSVQDNGIGISPEFSERIFIIFQRLHTRKTYPGTGIGLALCKRIVERHGGRIWVESEPGNGATFFFTLPAKLEETRYAWT